MLNQRNTTASTCLALAVIMAICTSCSTSKPADDNATACLNILDRINLAKRTMAMGHSLPDGTMLAKDQMETLGTYLPGGSWASYRCPSGGEYTVGAVGQKPSCSIHGTVTKPRTSR